MNQQSTICKTCGLPIAGNEHAGSLTSFLFVDRHCQCHLKATSPDIHRDRHEEDTCQRCGKVIPGSRRKGSLTAFLLKDLRCNCSTPLRKAKGAGDLSTRYKPSIESWTGRRQARETQRRTRAGTISASDAALVNLLPGAIIAGCYKLQKAIGQGGMGVVYRADHLSLARTVALKFLAPSMVSPEGWHSFQKEARLNSSLTHPAVCQIYDLGIHAGSLPYYAMDYVRGRTLEEIILQSGPLSVGATLEIFSKVLDCLAYAHRKSIVHKDIKPANIMVVDTADRSTEIKLLDFGIAELNEPKGKRSTEKSSKIIGSAAYMSPEQFAGRETDQRADIYSLGCSIFETLTGAPPFMGETFEDTEELHCTAAPPLLSDVTGLDFGLPLEAVLQKCLQKDRAARYTNASELAIDLKRLSQGKDLQFARAQYDSLMESRKPVPKQSGAAQIALIAAAGVVALTLLTLAGTMLVVKMTPPPPEVKTAQADHSSDSQSSIPDVLGVMSGSGGSDSHKKSTAVTLPPIKPGQFLVQRVTGKDGGVIRSFFFPFTDFPAYLLEIDKRQSLVRTDSMKGRVTVDQPLIKLALMGNVTNGEELISGFAPDDLWGLLLSTSGLEEHGTLKAAVTRCTRLNEIGLGEDQWTARNLALLAQMQNEYELSITGLDTTNKIVPRLDSDRRLYKLVIESSDLHLPDIFQKPELVYVKDLNVKNAPFNLIDARLVSKWPQLEMITLRTNISAEILEVLLLDKRLKKLTISDQLLDLSDLDMDVVKSNKNPQTIYLRNLPQTDINQEKIAELRKAGKNLILLNGN